MHERELAAHFAEHPESSYLLVGSRPAADRVARIMNGVEVDEVVLLAGPVEAPVVYVPAIETHVLALDAIRALFVAGRTVVAHADAPSVIVGDIAEQLVEVTLAADPY